MSTEDQIALLRRTPSALDALLRDLPDCWTMRNEGGDTWTVFDVVGHLIDGEYADWIPRMRRVLQWDDSKPFDPYDRSGHEQVTRGKRLGQLLDEFAEARAQSLTALSAMNLQAVDLERRGQHPALGAVTLSQLLSTWAAHDANHLHQIGRIMAYQCRDAVGPFRAYLGAMHCNGHGA